MVQVRTDSASRKIMVQSGCHNMGAVLERLYQPRAKGGRGLQSLLETWEKEVVSVTAYLVGSEDDQVQAAMRFWRQRAGTISGRQKPSC